MNIYELLNLLVNKRQLKSEDVKTICSNNKLRNIIDMYIPEDLATNFNRVENGVLYFYNDELVMEIKENMILLKSSRKINDKDYIISSAITSSEDKELYSSMEVIKDSEETLISAMNQEYKDSLPGFIEVYSHILNTKIAGDHNYFMDKIYEKDYQGNFEKIISINRLKLIDWSGKIPGENLKEDRFYRVSFFGSPTNSIYTHSIRGYHYLDNEFYQEFIEKITSSPIQDRIKVLDELGYQAEEYWQLSDNVYNSNFISFLKKGNLPFHLFNSVKLVTEFEPSIKKNI